jgi:stalled ribosome rescue protein Dom34
MLGSDEMRAWYGPDHVRLAADRGAVGTLLISDELFRYVESSQKLRSFLLRTGTEQAIREKGRNM